MSDPANYGIIQYHDTDREGKGIVTGILYIHMANGGKQMADRWAKALDACKDRWHDQHFVNAALIASIGREGLLSGVTFEYKLDCQHTVHLADFNQMKVLLVPNDIGADGQKWIGNFANLPRAKMGFPIDGYISKFKKD